MVVRKGTQNISRRKSHSLIKTDSQDLRCCSDLKAGNRAQRDGQERKRRARKVRLLRPNQSCMMPDLVHGIICCYRVPDVAPDCITQPFWVPVWNDCSSLSGGVNPSYEPLHAAHRGPKVLLCTGAAESLSWYEVRTRCSRWMRELWTFGLERSSP